MAGSVVRLGLIGAGEWGRKVIRAMASLDEVKLVRVGSANPKTKDLVPEDCLVVSDWRQVLNPAEIDGVVICSPPALHAEMAREAVSLGVPVLVEKPLTLDFAEAVGLKRLVDLSGGLVLVDHIHLFSPAFQTLAQLLAAVGPVRAIRGRGGNQGPFRSDASVLWDWGPHDVSMCLALMGGRPETVAARRISKDEAGEILGLTLTFEGGVEAELVMGNIMAEKARYFAVHTEKVVLVYDDLANHKLTLHPPTPGFADPEGSGEPVDIPGDQPLDVALATFAEALHSPERPSASLDLGLDVVAVLEECDKALG